jgi:hypothetical protein
MPAKYEKGYVGKMKDEKDENTDQKNDLSGARVRAGRMSRIAALVSGMDVFQLMRLEREALLIIEGKGTENV